MYVALTFTFLARYRVYVSVPVFFRVSRVSTSTITFERINYVASSFNIFNIFLFLRINGVHDDYLMMA